MPENSYIPDLVALSNYGSLLFTPTERLSLEFLYNRTVKFNKTSEAVSYSDWKKGIFSSEGNLVTAPSGIDRKTITKVIRSLEEKGFITIKEKRFGNTRVNYFTVHVRKITEELMKMALNISKKWNAAEEQKEVIRKERVGEKRTCGEGNNGHVPTGKTDTPSKNLFIQRSDKPKSRNKIESEDSIVTTKEKVEQTLTKVRTEHKSALQRKVNNMDSDPTFPGITSAWKLSCMDHYEGRTVVNNFKRLTYFKLKKGILSHQLPDHMGVVGFIDWVIENWSTLPSCELSWVRVGSFPSLPSFDYFAAMYKHFVTAYGELEERGVINAKRLDVATSRTDARKQVNVERQRIAKLETENQYLREKEQHLSRLVQEGHKPRTRKKIKMKPVDELDFSSIAPLPAF